MIYTEKATGLVHYRHDERPCPYGAEFICFITADETRIIWCREDQIPDVFDVSVQ